MKGFSGFGNSPAKQRVSDLPPNFNIKGSKGSTTPGYPTTKAAKTENFRKAADKIKTVKSNTKGFDKWMKIAGKAGSRALGVLGFMGAGTLSASAENKNVKKSEGEQIKNLLTKHKLKGGNN